MLKRLGLVTFFAACCSSMAVAAITSQQLSGLNTGLDIHAPIPGGPQMATASPTDSNPMPNVPNLHSPPGSIQQGPPGFYTAPPGIPVPHAGHFRHFLGHPLTRYIEPSPPDGMKPKLLTLSDAIYLALRYNPNIQSSEFNRVLTAFGVRVAEYQFQPQWSVGGSLDSSRTVSNSVLAHSQSYILTPQVSLETAQGGVFSVQDENNSDGNFFNPQLVIQFTQPLIRGSSYQVVMAPLMNAIDEYESGRYSLQGDITSSIENVIVAYRGVVALENSLSIQKESVGRAKQTVERTEKQIQAGTAPRADLAQGQLQVAQSSLNLVRIENSLRQAEQNLLIAIGLNPELPIIIPATVQIHYLHLPSLQTSINVALDNDPTYQSELLQLKIDKREWLVARDQLRPSLDATVSSTWGGGSGGPPFNNYHALFNGTNNSQSIGLQLNIPIDDYNLREGVISSEVAIQQQQIFIEQTKRQIATNVINAVNTIKAAELAIEFAHNQVHYARITLSDSYKMYNFGKTTILAVTQQEQSLTQAQQNAIATEIDYLNAVTRYESVLQLLLPKWKIHIRY